jgi:hypothetical protein
MKSAAQHLMLLAAFLAIAFTATAALAQEASSTTETDDLPISNTDTIRANTAARQENRDEIREQIDERRAEIQENMTERRTVLQEQIQNRIINLAANLSNRLDAVTTRLTNIADRLESRIQKLSENGIDTIPAAAELENARAAIDAAIATLSNIDELVNGAVGSENPRESWLAVKTTYLTVREHVMDARESLRITVTLLKEAIAAGVSTPEASDAVNSEESLEASI